MKWEGADLGAKCYDRDALQSGIASMLNVMTLSAHGLRVQHDSTTEYI
jgi:hypothetical protein